MASTHVLTDNWGQFARGIRACTLSDRKCRHCGERLSLLRALSSEFCSEQHETTERDALQHLMVSRLKKSAARFQEQLQQEALTKDAAVFARSYRQVIQFLGNATASPDKRRSVRLITAG